MKKKVGRGRTIFITVGVVLFVLFILIPLFVALIGEANTGNVALIPIHGIITVDGASYLGQGTVSSSTIVDYIKEAQGNPLIKVIVIEINSPGGSAVASDEIATAIKSSEKPVVALIREAGASGGYWIASAADHIIANRMSITGSIGVISSYLEFSGLMEKYGVRYERLVAGETKDIGTPFRQLTPKEEQILQQKLDRIHTFFITEIAANRNLPESQVRTIATGEFYLGVEALELGLVDQLGDITTIEQYIKETYNLTDIKYTRYERQPSLFDLFGGVFQDFSFDLGQGIGSIFFHSTNSNALTLV